MAFIDRKLRLHHLAPVIVSGFELFLRHLHAEACDPRHAGRALVIRRISPAASAQEECRSPVSRILSAPLARGWTVISLTPPERSAPLTRDATNTRRVTGGPPFPCFVLHHAGFAVPPWLPAARWALTPPFHPYLCPCGPSAVCFLLHFPSGTLASAVPCFHKARCPVVSGLSSSTLARACDRPGSGVPSVVRIPPPAKENFQGNFQDRPSGDPTRPCTPRSSSDSFAKKMCQWDFQKDCLARRIGWIYSRPSR